MGSARDRLELWLQRIIRPRVPELEEPLVKAANAFDAIQAQKSIRPDQLAAIVEAASSARRPLIETATNYLSELTGQFEEARDAVTRMSQDSRSQVRFNALLCLGNSTPKTLKLEALQRGLRDKSAKVRQKAADWAGRLRFREVVPDLEEAAGREQDAKAKKTIEFDLRLLRDGYILEPKEDDQVVVTAFGGHGGTTSRWISRSELERRGIDAIVEELGKQTY